MSREFSAEATAPALVRSFVRAELAGWDLARLTDVAELLVSEVVTNAVRHAGTGGTVELRRTEQGIRIDVADHGSGVPVRRTPGPDEIAGRGLGIVDTLASRWGVEELEDGKVVWFELT